MDVLWSGSAYATRFPMTPLGGLFVAMVGVSVVLGAAVRRWRMLLVWIGFAAGSIALVLGAPLSRGLPPPPTLQMAALALAIALEVAAFRVLMPRLRKRGERAVLVGTLVS